MEFLDLVNSVAQQFSKANLSPAVKDQIARSTIKSVEITGNGGFADLVTLSDEEAQGEGGEKEFSIVRTLNGPNEIGDVILHFNEGRVEYLEVWFYDSDFQIEELSNVTVT